MYFFKAFERFQIRQNFKIIKCFCLQDLVPTKRANHLTYSTCRPPSGRDPRNSSQSYAGKCRIWLSKGILCKFSAKKFPHTPQDGGVTRTTAAAAGESLPACIIQHSNHESAMPFSLTLVAFWHLAARNLHAPAYFSIGFFSAAVAAVAPGTTKSCFESTFLNELASCE